MTRVALKLAALAFFAGSGAVRAEQEVVLAAAGFAGGVISLPQAPANLGVHLPPLQAEPPAPANEHLAMGRPSAASTSNPDDYLMTKPQYALSYNNTTHNPNWVSWHLNSSWIGGEDRSDDFRADLDLPAEFVAVKPTDYDNTGFDRGHMCNSKDRTNSHENNSATFLMTNMIPQSPRDNEQTWKALESQSRKMALDPAEPELFIVSGPAGKGGVGRNGALDSIPIKRRKRVVGEITVPKCAWKVILAAPKGTAAGSQVAAGAETIAVIMPNNQTLDTDWHKYRVSVAQVEQLTHYRFFAEVDPAVADALKTRNESPSPTRCD